MLQKTNIKGPDSDIKTAKVIGIGADVAEIIADVRKFGYDKVNCLVAQSPDDCPPKETDDIVIILAQTDVQVANTIAKAHLDAGILTVGLVKGADCRCYNCLDSGTERKDFTETIKHLLQTLVLSRQIGYDFIGLCMLLWEYRYFKAIVADGKNIREAIENIRKKISVDNPKHNECFLLHLYFHSESQNMVKTVGMEQLSDMISKLPDNIDANISIIRDNTLPPNTVRLSIIKLLNEA